MTGKSTTVPWLLIAVTYQKYANFEREYCLLERGDAFYSTLFGFARHLVRLAAEGEKPNAERMAEYRDSNLESLKFYLFSATPIHPELEQAKLTASLGFLAENFGADHGTVKQIFAGKGPANRAKELVNGSKLADPAEPRRA